MNNNNIYSREGSNKQDTLSVPCSTYYDAATQEILKTTTDKLTIWLDECQDDVLKDKCNVFTSASSFMGVLGILITLITTLVVTDFPSELWRAIYLVWTAIIFFILIFVGYRWFDARRKKRPMKLSECVLQKIKDSSIVTTGDEIYN